jgi:predicted DNA-binding transcriptional regulator AlpA
MLEYISDSNNDNIRNFDSLPDSAHVRQQVVEKIFGCSSASVWRWARLGLIPPPKRFAGRVSAWNVGELRAALKTKV